ncbi:excinuclease ABC subunit UvrB [Candidatus Microgenomates bacterium]|nr:excinuclease ABC subunit UvrB [Candidatus Microgenomates bacterium]
MFTLHSNFKPTGDQPTAIAGLENGIKQGLKNQVLLGVTGSGKTFTMANIIRDLNIPTLIISHNKTLAGQLYQEFREFFPDNAVSYFVSYYDYYQPEAYIASSDTYIEKEAEINELIDKLRLQASTNIMTRRDVVVVASVSCIYNIGSPAEYGKFTSRIQIGEPADWTYIGKRLIELLYSRSEFDFKRGTYRIRGNYMDIYPAYEDFAWRVYSEAGKVSKLVKFEPLTGRETEVASEKDKKTAFDFIMIYPAKHYLMDPAIFKPTEQKIRQDLHEEYEALKKMNRIVEAERLLRRTNYDLEMIKEIGYVNGIENYSRYFDGRKPGDKPYSLLDYFKEAYGDDFLVFIDESHMTMPQIRGMFNGDHARKKMLIDFGFRLQAAYDNRPLRFEEFYQIPPKLVYVSATPNEWEIEQAHESAKGTMQKKDSPGSRSGVDAHPDEKYNGVVEQLIRPTGIIDPKIEVRPAKDEIQDLIKEVEMRAKRGEKILVTTLTKKTAEDLTDYLKERNVKAEYLHSDILTLERSNILENLRKGNYDVLIGVNLLREGLDLPEVYLVAILDADREGFLRSRTSLIQTMGRAARNVSGEVIMYADKITGSMKEAIDEINRRREYQTEYNKKHNITPKTVFKPIREKIIDQAEELIISDRVDVQYTPDVLTKIHADGMTAFDKTKMVKKLEREMKKQADQMNFELAIAIRNKITELKD